MAEAKNNFLKSKMNKDLDDRLVPEGEYRHAQNVSVAKSEGNDVGALENILGNDVISNFTIPVGFYNIEIIGHLMDVKNDRIIVFMTNYVDTSGDTLSNFSTGMEPLFGSFTYQAIGVYNIRSGVSSIVVSGTFLNFSKTHEIYGVNIIDDLLFWTDNRNQPRKINLSRALTDNSYYTTEDTISVSKYYPYQAIDLIEERPISISLTAPGTAGGSGYPSPPTPPAVTNYGTTAIAPSKGFGLTINVTGTSAGAITIASINNVGSGYANGDLVEVTGAPNGGGAIVEITTTTTSTMRDVVSDHLPDETTDNPYRQPYDNAEDVTWKGDPEYLKDKFVRFSYRFKFDDGEYSLIAPFTQTCFIPKQDGYFIDEDDNNAYQATDVGFMENKVNNIILLINSPTGNWNDINQTMKIEEVDILYKQAGQNTIRVVDTITSDQLNLVNSTSLPYNYISSEPWKTLPNSDILRVHDQVPVRALAQEVAGNRIIYGNYIDKPTPPASINYSCDVRDKNVNTQIEYQNQTLKQNRTYQVGIILSDRYGRQSTVILSSIDAANIASSIKGSTLFHKFKESPFSTWYASFIPATGSLLTSGTPPITPGDIWDGDILNLTFWDTISSNKSAMTGEPGLYALDNPLGWYSYKIVIKQTEQDYYNIYFPGILNGFIDGETPGGAATDSIPTSHFALHGDNINKVPRDLTLVGPNQKTFRSGRPSAKEDPDYYKFNIANGSAFSVVDMASDNGSFTDRYGAVSTQDDRRRLLRERDRERDLDSGSQITNASLKLSLRLNNVGPASITSPSTLTSIDTSTQQAYPGTKVDTVVTIGTGQDLGLWDASATAPYNTANVFYGYKDNPYIAKLNMSDINYGLVGPHPEAGRFNFFALCTGSGSDYAISNDVLCEIPTPSGAGVGFKVNIVSISTTGGGIRTSATTPSGNGLTISDLGYGWDMLSGPNPTGIAGCAVVGGGNGTARFNLSYTKSKYGGKMVPSLSVYETEPLESKLDIYWETSTEGLISYLNTQVLDGDTIIPISFGNVSGDPIDTLGLDLGAEKTGENIVIGGAATGHIYALNTLGNPVTGPCTFTLLSIFDEYNNDRFNDWEIDNAAGGVNGFLIRLKVIQMCDVDQLLAENFTFRINAQVPSATYGTDGSFINKVLVLGPLQLLNIQPDFVTPPSPALTGSINGGLIHTFNAVNGSVVGGGLETQSITFTLTDASGNFYLNSTTTDGQVQLLNNAAPAGTYDLTLNVFDGGGMSAAFPSTGVATVTLS